MDMILDPTVLFFCLGVLAVWFRSNIEVPAHTMKFLSYYLLMSIGFKGGIAMAKTTWTFEMLWTILAGLIASALIPVWMFFVLKRKLSADNAAAISACYGSVSAVTFLTAISWLENLNQPFSGHFVALMALMESPAIIAGILLAKLNSAKGETSFSLKAILHDAFFNGSIFLLIGSMAIGFVMNPARAADYQTFMYDIFKGFLCFFLLDLGMTAARQVRELRNQALFLGVMALAAPLINATLGLLIAKAIGLTTNDAFVFIVLMASASYIAVPAALRTSLPNAQPSLYLSMGLGLTFPFNILIGLPMYWWVSQNWL
jgi:hypothetical protein